MKNSIMPTTPLGLSSGNPNAACRPQRRAMAARGKFAFSGASTIHAGSPDSTTTPRQALSRRKGDPLAERLELGKASARMPGADAAQEIVAGPGLPDRAELPAERAADDLQDRRIHLDRPIAFGEDAGDRVLHSLDVADVGEPGADTTGAHR